MQNLKNEMKQLVERIDKVLREEQAKCDPHWSTCQRICNEFELWTETETGTLMPEWLMYIVSGYGRDNDLLV